MFIAKLLAVTGIAVAGMLAAPTPATEPLTLDRVTRQLVRDGAPGALAVVRTPSGLRRAHAGLARRRPSVPLAAADRFRVASITKTFVGVVVLQLADERRLRLDQPVARILPGLLPDGDSITIRELLGHTSGLFDYLQDDAFVHAVIAHPGRAWSPRRLVSVATSHPLLFRPGHGWSYSNTNYIVLGLVVEAVTGAPIGEELERRIFAPLRLGHTSFPSGLGIAGRHAHGYVGFATLPRLRSLFDATTVVSPSISWAAGGIVSNGDDVTAFYAALLGGHVLPRSGLAAMERTSESPHYGLGLFVADTPCGRAYGHIGIANGYRTVVYGLRGGRRVALVMVNVDATYVAQSELEEAAETALCSG
jgi:D-alanyl-D-alanine carboxypeptidase